MYIQERNNFLAIMHTLTTCRAILCKNQIILRFQLHRSVTEEAVEDDDDDDDEIFACVKRQRYLYMSLKGIAISRDRSSYNGSMFIVYEA